MTSEPGRRFYCADADYLTLHNIDVRLAARFPRRFGPAAIRELVEAGITPERANEAPSHLNATQVVDWCDDQS